MQAPNDPLFSRREFRIASPRQDSPGERRRAQSVAGAFAVHASLAILLIFLGRPALPPIAEERPALTMVFAPPPAPQPPVAQPAPEPPAPPEPEVNPFPPIFPVPEPQPEAPPPVPPPKPEPLPEPPRPALQPKPEPRPPTRPHKPMQRLRPARITPRPETRRAVIAPPIAAPSIEPSPTPPPTAAPALSASESLAGWRSALAAWLQAHKGYPEMARQKGDQGRVLVRFTVDRDGRVLNFALVQSSGSEILDGAAETLLRGARLPPFPPGMAQSRVSITLPIRYSLEH